VCLLRGTDWIVIVTAISFHLILLIETIFSSVKHFLFVVILSCRRDFLPGNTLQWIPFFQEYLKYPYSFASCTTIALHQQTLNNFGIRDLIKICIYSYRYSIRYTSPAACDAANSGIPSHFYVSTWPYRNAVLQSALTVPVRHTQRYKCPYTLRITAVVFDVILTVHRR